MSSLDEMYCVRTDRIPTQCCVFIALLLLPCAGMYDFLICVSRIFNQTGNIQFVYSYTGWRCIKGLFPVALLNNIVSELTLVRKMFGM